MTTTLTRLLIAFGVAWLVVGAAVWMMGSLTSSDAVLAAALATAVLGYGIWGLSGRLPIPGRRLWLFLSLHLVLAFAFGWTLLLISYGVEALVRGETLQAALRGGSARIELVFWTALYGSIATGCYSVRARRALAGERQAAVALQAAASEARLAALRGQLNPHFLFNALHGLAALIRRDPPRAEEAVERLGELLRYSLDGAGGDEVSLEDEWRFTRSYLEMERMGLGDRLRVTEEVDPGALEARLPPFALQTLVENAVRHGVAPRPGGASLTFRIRRAGSRLAVEVLDDGEGAAPDALAGARGTGLANLRQRLEALYGGEALLEVEPGAGGGVRARLEIPQP